MTQLFCLDVRTMLLLLALGNLSAAGLLLVHGNRLRNTPDGMLALTRLLQGLGWPLLALRGDIPDLFSIGLGNTLLMAGFWLETACIRALDQAARPWTAARAVLLGAVAASLILILLPQANQRVALGSALAAVSFVLSGLQLLRGAPNPGALRRTLGLAYLLLGMAVAWRSLSALLSSSVTLFTQDLSLTLAYVPLYLLMVAGSFGLLLVFKERSDQNLARAASHDELTGAPNRRAFLDMANRLAAQAHRDGTSLAALMLDIDHFKRVNDTFGHAVGDRVLTDLARIIAGSLRTYDAYGRFGGEEFVAVLPRASLEDAGHVAERIRATVQESRPVGDDAVRYTVSIGIAWGIPDTEGLSLLLHQADQAMYKAKRLGRNRTATPATDEAEET